jgi:hemolysin III
MVLLYSASSLYHGIQNQKVKRVFHVFDHIAIFTLIAGTYTPITLCAIQGGWGWSLFGVVWGMAILGAAATAIFFEKARYFNVALYIAMGWIIVITGPRIFDTLSREALLWLGAGGLFYTGGVIFYKMKRVKYHHMIWHLFVLAGSVCHFFLMFYI